VRAVRCRSDGDGWEVVTAEENPRRNCNRGKGF
jgi:hypothetical protein